MLSPTGTLSASLRRFSVMGVVASLWDSPMEGSGLRPPKADDAKDLLDVGVLKPLRLEGRMTAVAGSASRSTADSRIGVAPAAMGVWPSSACEKNLAFPAWLSNEVMSFRAEFLPMWRCGPRLSAGGESGGLRTSPMLGPPTFWKVSWAAEGDAHGSVDSWPEHAKLQR